MPDLAIKVEGLSKRYRIGQYIGGANQYRALRDVLTDAMHTPFRRLRARNKQRAVASNPTADSHELPAMNHEPSANFIWALKDVSFEVKQGEVVGIIGRNGAGKSTLLKVLSRITEPTEGRAEIKGRMRSLLEVGTGFNSELTGRENTYLSGAILGMTKKEIHRKFDEIVAFSGVEKFIDTPVKRYSSGMLVRLGFAVAAHLEPEILLIDEVLAVGDVQFQKKCLGKMKDVASGGRTVLFVSHNMQSINSLCNRAILFENGRIAYSGSTMEAINKYLKEGKNRKNEKLEWIAPEKELPFSDVVKIKRYYIQDEEGNIPNGQLFNSKKYKVVIEAEIFKTEPNLVFFISYYTEDGTLLFISDIHDAGDFDAAKLSHGKKRITTSVPVHLFANRTYKIELSCVIHRKGWPLIPDISQRMQFVFFRDNNPNKMVYDETTHPFSGASKPGLLNPVIKWEIF